MTISGVAAEEECQARKAPSKSFMVRTHPVRGPVHGLAADVLQGRGYAGLSVDYRVVEGQDHGSVYPAFITDALVWALPGRNPKYHEGDTAQSP